MEAATPLNRTHVRVVGERVLADGLVIADEHLVALAVEAADPERVVQDAVAIGARVLRREGAAVDVDALRSELEHTAERVRTEFTERAGKVAERLDARVDAAFGAEDGTVARLLARHFGDESNDAVQHKVRAVLRDMSEQVREDLRKQFSAESDDNPLAAFHRTQLAVLKQTAGQHTEALEKVTDRMEGLRLEVERLRAEKDKLEELAAERDRGTAKGRDFEEALAEALDAIALAQGDDCEAVGDRADSGSAKVGDMVVTIDGCNSAGRGRIVFEAKNSRVARPEMLRQLDKALVARRADFGVMVVAGEENLPANTTQLREMHGDKLVVAWDPAEGSDIALRVAYSLARARVLMRQADSEGIDGAAIRTAVERALQGLEQVRNVKQQLTASKSAIEKAGGHVDALAAAVKMQLAEIDALVAAAGDPQLALDA